MLIKSMAAIAVALPLACAFAGSAQAQGLTYTAEVGYERVSFTGDPKFDVNAVNFRGGAQFLKHFGVEMDVAAGLGGENVSYQGINANVKMQYAVGVYGVGYLPLAKGVDLFARVGAVGLRDQVSVSGSSGNGNEHGYAVGAGLRWFPMGGKNGLRVEYTRWGLQDDIDTFGATFVHKF
jgi:hypothetical protein